MTTATESPVFNYKALRFLMGLIALALPYTVILISSKPLTSISAAYYTEARDVFIGMLFIVSAFMWAYNGHTISQKIASKIASVATMLLALFPTSCDGCELNIVSMIHAAAAVVLFSILAYFCLGPFREKTRGQGGKKGRRAIIYLVCGWVMILAMLSGLIALLVMSDAAIEWLRVIFWVELVSLNAFGIAWIVAGKYIRLLVDEQDSWTIRGNK